MSIDVVASVTRAWYAALELPPTSESPDFFDAGGTSVTAVRMMGQVESELGIEFPLESLFLEGRLDALVVECSERFAALKQS